MSYSYLIPNWFFGFDIAMEALFAIITFLVAFYSLKVYGMTRERKVKLFGTSFLLICFSYIILGALNYWFVRLASEGFREVSINDIQFAGILSLYLYMILFITGLITLTYVTSNFKTGRSYYLIFGLSIILIAASFNKLVTFRILSVFLLSFITYQYLIDYMQNKRKREFWTVIAFTLLLLSSLDFMFSSSYYQAYLIGHLLELFGYLIILVILIRSVRR